MSWALIPLSEEQKAIQLMARNFARAEVAPHAVRWDREGSFDRSLVEKLGALGFLGMMIPEALDGMGLDTCTYVVALEEIAAADASAAVLMSVHNSLPTQMILRYGSDAQREHFLRPMARGEWLGAFALSEPDAGSDAASLRAQAVRDGDSYVLNGVKAWVSHGSMADVILCMVRTDSPSERKGARGIGTFILTPDMPGLSIGKKEDKMGLRGDPTVQIVLDGVRVPVANRLGAEGVGFIQAMQSLESGRLGIAAQAIGIARAALEHSVAYAAERKQFGKPIKEFQAIQFKLADMATRVTSSRALLYAAAAARDRGESITQFASMAKLQATETAMWVTTQAIQIFGGYGYVKEYPVEKLFRDAKVTEIYEGTSEIQRIVIARELYARS
jgi:alkylation response protein AidB-like acyl-CoA dehydrogenase